MKCETCNDTGKIYDSTGLYPSPCFDCVLIDDELEASQGDKPCETPSNQGPPPDCF